jgi:hypothetical protein
MVSGPSAERMFAPGRFQVRLGQSGFRNEQDVPGTIRVESVARVSAAREDPHIACAHAGYDFLRLESAALGRPCCCACTLG